MTTKVTKAVSSPARYKKDTKEGKHVAFIQNAIFPPENDVYCARTSHIMDTYRKKHRNIA